MASINLIVKIIQHHSERAEPPSCTRRQSTHEKRKERTSLRCSRIQAFQNDKSSVGAILKTHYHKSPTVTVIKLFAFKLSLRQRPTDRSWPRLCGVSKFKHRNCNICERPPTQNKRSFGRSVVAEGSTQTQTALCVLCVLCVVGLFSAGQAKFT